MSPSLIRDQILQQLELGKGRSPYEYIPNLCRKQYMAFQTSSVFKPGPIIESAQDSGHEF